MMSNHITSPAWRWKVSDKRWTVVQKMEEYIFQLWSFCLLNIFGRLLLKNILHRILQTKISWTRIS